MKRDRRAADFRRLVTLGESTTAGGWASHRGRCWASLLEQKINLFQTLPVQLFNSGLGANLVTREAPAYPHSGRPAADERLERDVIRHEPDLLILAYGLNDARGGTSLPLFIATLASLINRVRERLDPLIVIVGSFYACRFRYDDPNWEHADLIGLRQFSDASRGVAEDHDCLFVEMISAFDGADWLMHYDGVHANDLGHQVIADRIFGVLAANCTCLATRTKALEPQIAPWRDESTLRTPILPHT